jgi:hypothetical protein
MIWIAAAGIVVAATVVAVLMRPRAPALAKHLVMMLHDDPHGWECVGVPGGEESGAILTHEETGIIVRLSWPFKGIVECGGVQMGRLAYNAVVKAARVALARQIMGKYTSGTLGPDSEV